MSEAKSNKSNNYLLDKVSADPEKTYYIGPDFDVEFAQNSGLQSINFFRVFLWRESQDSRKADILIFLRISDEKIQSVLWLETQQTISSKFICYKE